MSHKELIDALNAVHQELAQSEDLDPDDVEKLRATIVQIESVLQAQSAEQDTLSHHVTHAAENFEQSHPRLTQTLGRIADMLQQMGI